MQFLKERRPFPDVKREVRDTWFSWFVIKWIFMLKVTNTFRGNWRQFPHHCWQYEGDPLCHKSKTAYYCQSDNLRMTFPNSQEKITDWLPLGFSFETLSRESCDTVLDFCLKNSELTNRYCLKLLNLWEFVMQQEKNWYM